MILKLELRSGPNQDERVYKEDAQKNIDALKRAIDGKLLAHDFVYLQDTILILKAIQKQLPWGTE